MACFAIFSGMVCSCSDDDDKGGESTNASVSINGQSVNFSHACYTIDTGGGCVILFSDFNMLGEYRPQRGSALMIFVPSQNGTIPTGTIDNTKYFLDLGVNTDMYTENYDYYLEGGEGEGGDLVISKNGDTYTITIDDMRLTGYKDGKDGEDGEWVSVTTSFSYTGTLPKADIYIEE